MSETIETTTADILREARSKPEVVATKPDGSASIVRTLGGGRVSYEVTARLPDGGEATLVRTIHDDVAASVFDAYDGAPRPWHPVYQPRGFNNREEVGGMSKEVWVFAVGATAEDAIRGFGDSLGNVPAEVAIDHLEEGGGEWEARFRLDGTGMKAGGRIVPGGYVLTDWK